MVTIALLADHPEVIPTLVRWFRTEWPDYYAERDPAQTEREFHSELQRDRLPIRLIAFEAGELVGTIVVREQALTGWPEYSPALGGLYVAVPHRGRGIGTELVRAGMAVARGLGYESLYTGTEVAGGILVRLGWEQMQTVSHGHERVPIYRCVLNDPA